MLRTEAESLIQNWVVTLESGDYQQARLYLRATAISGGDGYCCLGVFCDLSNPHAWVKDDYGEWYWDTDVTMIPEELIRDISDALELDYEDLCRLFTNLANRNDKEGATFIELAEQIRMFFTGHGMNFNNKVGV